MKIETVDQENGYMDLLVMSINTDRKNGTGQAMKMATGIQKQMMLALMV